MNVQTTSHQAGAGSGDRRGTDLADRVVAEGDGRGGGRQRHLDVLNAPADSSADSRPLSDLRDAINSDLEAARRSRRPGNAGWSRSRSDSPFVTRPTLADGLARRYTRQPCLTHS